MASFVGLQEATLRERAESEHRYADLLYFYAAQRALDKLDGLAPEIDPKNEAEMLAFELFQGTPGAALLPSLNAQAEPWIRYTLLKALLKDDAREEALTLWKRSVSWQNADLLLAGTLIQYLLAHGRFDEANTVLPVARNLAPDLPAWRQWQEMVTGRQKLERPLRLDPLPPDHGVAFFLGTRDAAPFLSQTLAGIAAQNYPIADVLVVDDGNVAQLPKLREQFPIRVIDGELGLPQDISATWFAMVPPNAAPAVDFVQQFLLALENGPEQVSRAAGRVEDFYQETPGDRWRVFRMRESLPEKRVVGEAVPVSGALLRPRQAPETGESIYIPEAVACGLQQDTVDSALASHWKALLPSRKESGHFKDAVSLVKSFDAHRERMVQFINDDIDEGRSSLIFPDFLTLFHAVAMDAQLAAAQGLLDESAAARIQQAVLDSVRELDKEYKRDLTGKLREQLKERLLSAPPANALPADVEQALTPFIGKLHELYNGFPQDLYLAIYG